MINWITLNQEEQLQSIINDSRNSPVVLFKHSTSCSISVTVKSRLERQWNSNYDGIKVYYLDLLSYRSISNKIAQDFGVRHESPQLLLIRNGVCVYHASHLAINASAVEHQLAS